MRKVSLKIILLISALLFSGLVFLADAKGDTDNCTLFKVCRSRDANEIFYTLKTTREGTLDLIEPINIFWIKNTENGKSEPLTKVQQRFSYGLKYLNITPDSADFYFVSFPEKILKLQKNKLGNYCVFTEVDGKAVELERVFIQIDGGTFWFPKVSRVELHAKNPNADKLVVEIIQPKKE
jgi:hypothetical protein